MLWFVTSLCKRNRQLAATRASNLRPNSSAYILCLLPAKSFSQASLVHQIPSPCRTFGKPAPILHPCHFFLQCRILLSFHSVFFLSPVLQATSCFHRGSRNHTKRNLQAAATQQLSLFSCLAVLLANQTLTIVAISYVQANSAIYWPPPQPLHNRSVR